MENQDSFYPAIIDLYSWWATLWFILYILFNTYLPYWINPFPTLFCLFFVQIAITLYSYYYTETAKSILIGFMIWKYIMVIFVPATTNIKTIIFNIFIFLLYMLLLFYTNKNPIHIYKQTLHKRLPKFKNLYNIVLSRLYI